MSLHDVVALTIDLDDTLWPIRPTLAFAERQLAQWLRIYAPTTATNLGGERGMLELRARVAAEHPDWAHDLSAIRLETIRRALNLHGDDARLAPAAFEVYFEARHQVTLYDDVVPALQRLATRYRLIALSNGNADVNRLGLGAYFLQTVSARQHGAAKPAASIFHAACAAAQAPPSQVLHLGDDLQVDVDGALAAGLQAGWICRPDGGHGESEIRPGVQRFLDLLETATALGC